MEQTSTRNDARQTNSVSFASNDRDDELTKKRLEFLLQANAATAREKAIFRSKQEMMESALMKNPVSIENSFAYFGLLLGIFPPAAMFTRFLIDARIFQSEDLWILGIIFIVNLISAMVGYFSGKLIGKIVSELEKVSWHKMLLALPFVGACWGIIVGGAGGIIIFIIGAFVGAFLGALVGSVALPAFTIFHRLLKRGDNIDRRHFLPFAFGVTFIISAFFLGL
ncbi:MAG: hypothetical protein LC768_00070 [Acidobacteria bacterium]|nr:hypothetical protein [Acidobacteriota bacterium]MCA1636734.1 hypothetical protein [Acidobacteriota bacterium]